MLDGAIVAEIELVSPTVNLVSAPTEKESQFKLDAKQPTFDATVELNELALTQLNDYLRAYGNLDVEQGTLSIDAEFAASMGGFKGYVKPFIENLDILQWEQEEEGLPNKLWQGLADTVGELLEDQDKDRVATRIPFEGRLENPDADVWTTLGGLLRNAFIEALRRGVERRIKLSSATAPED